MKSIRSLKNTKGKIVLIRVDFNVPVKNGIVEDDFRILKALPTIKLLKKMGARIILISHFGKGGESLLPVYGCLEKYIKAKFVRDLCGEEAHKAIMNLKNGEVLLLENLRNDKGEKECDKKFAKKLANIADVYVNEAFSVSHRKDASIVLLPKLLPAYAGLQLEAEIRNLSMVFQRNKKPFLFILGGAKFSTKMPLIKKYKKKADYLFIGGALANDFLKAKGYEVGKSLTDDTKEIKILLKDKKIILPEDVVVSNNEKLINKKIDEVEKGDQILDVGISSINKLENLVQKSKLILWNGPLGKYEAGGGGATREILKSMAKAKAISIIGGGDTVSLISEMKMENKFTFVSTGGGATLDFLANGTLPGIKALE